LSFFTKVSFLFFTGRELRPPDIAIEAIGRIRDAVLDTVEVVSCAAAAVPAAVRRSPALPPQGRF